MTARAHAARHKDSLTALARLAQAELSAGNVALAGAVAGQALLVHSDYADDPAKLAAAEVLRATGDPAEARARLAGEPSGELERSLKARLAVDCGDFEDARELLAQPETFEALRLAAWLEIRRGKNADAVGLLRKALKRAGPTPEVLINLGFAHASLGHMRHAIHDTRQAQALVPHSEVATYNLVSFFTAIGDFDGALRALEPFERSRPGDVGAALTRAHVTLQSGDRREAHRILQRTRTSSAWATAPQIYRVELDANLGWLRWITGKRAAAATRQLLLEQLRLCDFKSLAIASFLPSLLTRSDDHAILASVIEKLQEHYTPTALLALRVSAAVLRRDAADSVRLAREWVRSEPLNPRAASIAVQLLDALGDNPGEALAVGLDALKRAPGDPPLCNNVAYVLAWHGRVHEARAVLARVHLRIPTVALLATHGLVDLLGGDVTRGLDGYAKAQAEAEGRGEPNLASLADLNRDLACRYLARQGVVVPDHGSERVPLSSDEADDTNAWLFACKARQLGL